MSGDIMVRRQRRVQTNRTAGTPGSRLYTVYIMARPKHDSAVLTIRVPAALDRQLAREARRRRKTRSQVARAILEAGLGPQAAADPAAEARRQSLLVRRRRSEHETLKFIVETADLHGWDD